MAHPHHCLVTQKLQSTYFNVLYAYFIIGRKIRIYNTRILLLDLTYGRTMHMHIGIRDDHMCAWMGACGKVRLCLCCPRLCTLGRWGRGRGRRVQQALQQWHQLSEITVGHFVHVLTQLISVHYITATAD